MFAIIITLPPLSNIFRAKLGAYPQSGVLLVPTQVALQPLHSNIRLVWKGLRVANALAYYDIAKITAAKKLNSLDHWLAQSY